MKNWKKSMCTKKPDKISWKMGWFDLWIYMMKKNTNWMKNVMKTYNMKNGDIKAHCKSDWRHEI